MERLERRDSSTKLGVWVLAVLSCVAVVALIVMILTVHPGDKPPTTSNTTEPIHGVTENTTAKLHNTTVGLCTATGSATVETTATDTLTTKTEGGSNWCEKWQNYTNEIKCENSTEEDETARKENWIQVKNNIKNLINKVPYLEKLDDVKDMIEDCWETIGTFNYFCTKGKSDNDLRGIYTAKQHFKNASNWTLLEGDTSSNWTFKELWKIESLFKKLFLEGGGLIKTTVGLNEKGTFLIKIGKPDLTLPTEDLDILEYWMYKTKVAKLFGAEEKLIETEIKKVFKFEKALVEFIQSRKVLRKIKYSSFEALNKIESLSYISWEILLSFFKSYDSEGVQYEIEDMEYLTELRHVIERNFKDVANFIFWRIAEQLAPYISKDFRTNLPFGQRKNSPQDYCLETVSRHTVPIIFQKYESNVLKSKKEEVKKIADNIRQEIINYVKSTKKSLKRKKIIEKIKSIKVHIGYPKELIEDEKLKKSCNEFNKASNFKHTTNFLEAHLSLSKWNSEEMIKKNRMYTEWMNFDDLIKPTASYSESQKYIAINIGLLEHPYFNLSMSSSEKYGSLGYTIADLFIRVLGGSVCKESPCSETINVAFKALKRSESQVNSPTPDPSKVTTKLQAISSQSPLEITKESQAVITSNSNQVTPGVEAQTRKQITLPAMPTSPENTPEQLFIDTVVNTMCKTYRKIKVETIMPTELKKALKCFDEFKTTTEKTNSPNKTTTKKTEAFFEFVKQ